jgi:phenylacetate-CoA ligase
LFRRSAAASLASRCCGERHYQWLGVPETAPVAAMRSTHTLPQPVDMDTVPPDQDDDPPDHHGARPQPRFDTGRRDVSPLAWLAETGARHLMTYPTYARGLAQDMRAGRGPAVHLDLVLTCGEVLTEETRAEIAAAFGARVADRYATEEAGMLAGECAHGGHHIQSEINLVEVVDEAGRPAPPGVEGQVVITSFYNYAMPLIRYAIGDRATLAEAPCPCGRHLPLLKGVVGRARDLFRFADGRSIWPYVPYAEVRRFVEMRQMQIVQVAHDRVELHYVPEGAGQVDREGAAAVLRKRFGADVMIDFVARDVIPRLPGGKYFDCVSLLPPD